jgi:hypothetical protein
MTLLSCRLQARKDYVKKKQEAHLPFTVAILVCVDTAVSQCYNRLTSQFDVQADIGLIPRHRNTIQTFKK